MTFLETSTCNQAERKSCCYNFLAFRGCNLNKRQTSFRLTGSSDLLKMKKLHWSSRLNFSITSITVKIRLRVFQIRLRKIIFRLAPVDFSPSTFFNFALGKIPVIVEEEIPTLLQLFPQETIYAECLYSNAKFFIRERQCNYLKDKDSDVPEENFCFSFK